MELFGISLWVWIVLAVIVAVSACFAVPAWKANQQQAAIQNKKDAEAALRGEINATLAKMDIHSGTDSENTGTQVKIVLKGNVLRIIWLNKMTTNPLQGLNGWFVPVSSGTHWAPAGNIKLGFDIATQFLKGTFPTSDSPNQTFHLCNLVKEMSEPAKSVTE